MKCKGKRGGLTRGGALSNSAGGAKAEPGSESERSYASSAMPSQRTKTVIQEISGRGFQKRTAYLDPTTKEVRCYLAGGIPYARSIDASQRWRRARPLPVSGVRYGTHEHPTDCTGVAAVCPQPGRPVRGGIKENCLQLNVWIPAGEPPAHGWPVFFYIHGGFLQWGTPNAERPMALLSETPLRAMIVAPTYRLNAFGFLASASFRAADPEIVTNVGFWDQRLALEWTFDIIADYGGNPENITVGGLSAGAYSTFHQLAHDVLRAPKDRRLIKRVIMWSNGCGFPAKPEIEFRSHVAMLLAALNIPTNLDAATQLARLRTVSAAELVKAVDTLPENSFRIASDAGEQNPFVSHSLFADLRSGELARRLRDQNITLLCGEVRDEINSYRLNSPPSSYDGLVRRLSVEYPAAMAARIASLYCDGKQTLPRGYSSWQDLFGRVYSDMQVHVSQRGLLACLYPIVPADRIFRYHIRWRPKCVDATTPRDMGVSHGTDMSVWWFGNGWGQGLGKEEKENALRVVEPLGKFLNGEKDIGWETQRIDELRVMLEDGKGVEIRKDLNWEAGPERWRAVMGGKENRL